MRLVLCTDELGKGVRRFHHRGDNVLGAVELCGVKVGDGFASADLEREFQIGAPGEFEQPQQLVLSGSFSCELRLHRHDAVMIASFFQHVEHARFVGIQSWSPFDANLVTSAKTERGGRSRNLAATKMFFRKLLRRPVQESVYSKRCCAICSAVCRPPRARWPVRRARGRPTMPFPRPPALHSTNT